MTLNKMFNHSDPLCPHLCKMEIIHLPLGTLLNAFYKFLPLTFPFIPLLLGAKSKYLCRNHSISKFGYRINTQDSRLLLHSLTCEIYIFYIYEYVYSMYINIMYVYI